MEFKIISETKFEKIKKQVNENSEKQIIFTSENDELNRKVIEKIPIKILLLNQKNRKDFQKQRNSGLNSVLAKILKKNNIRIGINLDEIINSDKKTQAEIIARVKQNIKLCNKNKINLAFIGKHKRNLYDLKALGLILGMPTKRTKNLQTFFN